MSERTDALVNGALIALGAAAVLDNVFSHWLFGLHLSLKATRRHRSRSRCSCSDSCSSLAAPGGSSGRESG